MSLTKALVSRTILILSLLMPQRGFSVGAHIADPMHMRLIAESGEVLKDVESRWLVLTAEVERRYPVDESVIEAIRSSVQNPKALSEKQKLLVRSYVVHLLNHSGNPKLWQSLIVGMDLKKQQDAIPTVGQAGRILRTTWGIGATAVLIVPTILLVMASVQSGDDAEAAFTDAALQGIAGQAIPGPDLFDLSALAHLSEAAMSAEESAVYSEMALSFTSLAKTIQATQQIVEKEAGQALSASEVNMTDLRQMVSLLGFYRLIEVTQLAAPVKTQYQQAALGLLTSQFFLISRQIEGVGLSASVSIPGFSTQETLVKHLGEAWKNVLGDESEPVLNRVLQMARERAHGTHRLREAEQTAARLSSFIEKSVNKKTSSTSCQSLLSDLVSRLTPKK